MSPAKHVYEDKHRGVVSKGLNTEFAGLPYEKQLEKIRKGKDILLAHGINTNVFFAPSHSYDYNTLKALSACGFKYNDDGKSTKIIPRNGIQCVPCRSGGAFSLIPQSHKTFVFHAHEWTRQGKENGYNHLVSIGEKYQGSFVDFGEYVEDFIGNKCVQDIDEHFFLVWERFIYPYLLKLWHKIRLK